MGNKVFVFINPVEKWKNIYVEYGELEAEQIHKIYAP